MILFERGKMKKFRSIIITWVAVVAFAVFIIKGTSIGTPDYFFSESLGITFHTFDFVAAIPVIFAIEFTARKLRKIREMDSTSVLEDMVSETTEKITGNKYSSGTQEYVNVATQPMNIVQQD